MKPRIIYIHGNQSLHWSFGWAPWLKHELENHGFPVFFETFPDSIIARAKYWLPFLKEHIGAAENDVIVGWSSGAVAAMRYAEVNRIRGSILVAPCVSDLGDALERESGYYDKSWDWTSIKKNQQHLALVHSDNDPYIPQAEFELIAQELHPEVIKIPGAKHFIDQRTFPEVLDCILRAYSDKDPSI